MSEALRIFKQAVEVVRVIHGTNRVHRDITPRNMLMRAANPILIDFGTIALDTGSVEGVHAGISAGGYHAPEQARGAASKLCDIFSLGSCLYFLLTGMDPAEARPDGSSEVRISEEMAKRRVPLPLQEIVRKARSWDPLQRYRQVEGIWTAVHLFERPHLTTCSACGAFMERRHAICPACGLRHCTACRTGVGNAWRCPACGRVICAWCNTAMRTSAVFCPGCGTSPRMRTCPRCKALVPLDSRYCRLCAATAT